MHCSYPLVLPVDFRVLLFFDVIQFGVCCGGFVFNVMCPRCGTLFVLFCFLFCFLKTLQGITINI